MGTHTRAIAIGLLLCGLLAPRTAVWAHSSIDGIEHIFGATNVNAITGHGGLSVGVSADGDVTVLSWPNPSYTDQLAYLSSNAIEARDQPRLGAPEGAGLFLGLLVEHDDGARVVTWLRDRSLWNIEQDYGPGDGANVHTRHFSELLGLSVEVVDAVAPPNGEADLLVRRVRVERSEESTVRAAWLLTYANLSPTPPNSKVPELPIADWAYDGGNDYAAIWDAGASAIVHFHPEDQLVFEQIPDLVFPQQVSYGPIGDQLARGTPDAAARQALVDGIDGSYAAGSYLALSTQPAPDQFQIGYDGTPMCDMRDHIADNVLVLPEIFPGTEVPIDPSVIDVLRCPDEPPVHEQEGWTHEAADAFADTADGELSGSGIAAGEVNEALRTPLVFEPDGGAVAEAAVILAAASNAATARTAVAAADPGGVESAAEAALQEWLATVRLPEDAPAEVRAVARRSLINLRVGTDRLTGTIVASISRQPPYGLDWPRDGAFFNVALDVSGQSELVGRRAALYADWQRTEPVLPTLLIDQPPPVDPRTGEATHYPAGAWEMNYYADGRVGGPFRFEIDNTAFAVWTMVTHAGWEDAPQAYLESLWPSIELGADLLADWRDAENGLQAPASEDDNAPYTQTLHGAVTVYGALEVAARAARMTGRDGAAERWEARGCELRDAIAELLYDEDAMRFVRRPGDDFDPARAPTGASAWLVWPMRVFPWGDPRVQSQLEGDLGLITPRVELETAGGAYFMKNTVSFGLTLAQQEPFGDEIEALRDQLATDHVTPATRHFGEAMVVRPGPEGPVASQRVANPHLWEGILFYLTAMAVEAPDAFDRHEAVLPASRIPAPGEPCPSIAPPCGGDCDGSLAVTVDELITCVNQALDGTDECAACDVDGDGTVTVTDLITAVTHALNGCP